MSCLIPGWAAVLRLQGYVTHESCYLAQRRSLPRRVRPPHRNQRVCAAADHHACRWQAQRPQVSLPMSARQLRQVQVYSLLCSVLGLGTQRS